MKPIGRPFFEHYYRWMRHYALLAEMYEADMLCVGVEFAQATLAREEDWRQLIRRLRGIYRGPLVYAANWGEEYEQLAFWDELDAIGLNCYYPLGQEDSLDLPELTRRFSAILDKVEKTANKWNKPLFFTEIGFRSVAAPWQQPHAEAGDRHI